MGREQPPPWVVVLAASSGGVKALSAFVAKLPTDLPAAVLIASHTPVTSHRRLPGLLSAVGPLPASYPDDGQRLEGGRILVAPPDQHLVLTGPRVRLTRGTKEHHLRPAADVLFRSAAREFGPLSMGIVLSGGGNDGAAGLAAIQAAGGRTLIQDPHDAELATMPLSALALVTPDVCAPAGELAAHVVRFMRERGSQVASGALASGARQHRRPLTLKGLRTLVAEDEYLIATEIVSMLRELGCRALGPVPDVASGLRLLEQARPDCAVLDVDLRGEQVLPLARALQKQDVPLVFATGYGSATLPTEWAEAPRIQKPYDARALGAALQRALGRRRAPEPHAPSPVRDVSYQEEMLKDARNLLMRSRLLRDSATDKGLQRSYEVMRQTHELIASSKVRKETTRRRLQQPRAPPRVEPENEDGEEP
jgi:DNA-binding response OmpR family regulator